MFYKITFPGTVILLIVLVVASVLLAACAGPDSHSFPPPTGYASWDEYYDAYKAQTGIDLRASKPQPSPTTSSSPTASTSEPESNVLKQIVSWSGSDTIENTEPFRITKAPWAVVWSHTASDSDETTTTMLNINIFRTSDTQSSMAMAAMSMETASDVYYVYETGEFFLNINAVGTTWSIAVMGQE
jgi:hypothetical protein